MKNILSNCGCLVFGQHFQLIENAGKLENIFMFIVKFWLPLKFSEIIFHHLLEDIKTKKKKTHPKPLSPHPQPCLRTNPTTEFGQTMIESDYQRRVPQLPPFLDYFSISLINEPMLQNDETQPCMRRLNC